MCYTARLWYKWCTFCIRGRKKCKIVTNEPTTPCLQCWLHIIQLSPIICLRCWNYWKTFSCVQLLWNSNGVWQKRWIQIGEVRKQTKGGIGVGGIATSPKSIQSKKIKWLYILTNDVKWKAATTAALSLKSLGNKGSQPTENKQEYLQVCVGGALQRIPEGSCKWVGGLYVQSCKSQLNANALPFLGGVQCICSEQQMQCTEVKFVEQCNVLCSVKLAGEAHFSGPVLSAFWGPVQGSVHWVGGGGGGGPTWGYWLWHQIWLTPGSDTPVHCANPGALLHQCWCTAAPCAGALVHHMLMHCTTHQPDLFAMVKVHGLGSKSKPEQHSYASRPQKYLCICTTGVVYMGTQLCLNFVQKLVWPYCTRVATAGFWLPPHYYAPSPSTSLSPKPSPLNKIANVSLLLNVLL